MIEADDGRFNMNTVLKGLNMRPRYSREGLAARLRAQSRLDATSKLTNRHVALIVLEQEMKIVDRVVEANQSLENKASGVAIIDIALIGVLATMAIERHTSVPWIAALALIGFLTSTLFAWQVNRVQSHNLPSPVTYNLPTIADDATNAAKIAQELVEAWDSYAIDERNAGVQKAGLLTWAFKSLYVGIVAFAIVTAIGVFTTSESNIRTVSGHRTEKKASAVTGARKSSTREPAEVSARWKPL